MDYDAIVVGAGPGGTVAARDLARAGLKVGLFDAAEQERLGKSIIVEAEQAMYDVVGLRRPAGSEVPYDQARVRVFSGRGKECFTVEGEHPAGAVRLDELSRRLAAEAVAAGAEFVGGHRCLGPIVEKGQVTGAVFQGPSGEREVRARLTIDASGFAAALVRKLPAELGIEFVDRVEDVVIAENYFHEIDAAKARAAIERRLHFDHEVWNRLGKHGNYSTEYSYLSLEHGRAYILLGRKASYHQPPIGDMIDKFREEQGYYGKCLYGGGGPIRVRRALDQLVADGLMVIGEAACTIICAHGSGVSSALYTGHLAAKTAGPVLKSGADPTAAALWPYGHAYQTGRGAVLATYAAQKLSIDLLSAEQELGLVEDGGMQAEDVYKGTVPAHMGSSLGAIPGRVRGVLKHPDLLPALAKMGLAIGRIRGHYQRYPARYDRVAVEAWKRKTRELFRPLEPKA